MRYRIDMSYDGAGFCGWQIQPQEPSVQEAVERALGTLLHARIAVTGAGRTDTGVSASHYVAHFDFDGPVPTPLQFHVVDALLPEDGSLSDNCLSPEDVFLSDNCLDCNQLRYKLNAVLPRTVSVQRVEPVDPDFHARFGAKKRQYTYFLHRAKDPFVGGYSYYFAYPEFDVEAMNRAASLLLGTHDFSCFEKSGGDNKTSICTVAKALWEPYTPTVCSGGVPQINGSGFLSQKDVPTDSSGAVSDCADAVSNRAGAVSEADGAVSDCAGAVSERDGAVSDCPGATLKAADAVSNRAGAVSEADGAVSDCPGATLKAADAVSNRAGAVSEADGAVSDCAGATLKAADAVSNRAGAVSEADGAVSDCPGATLKAADAVSNRAGAVSEADRSKGEPLYWRFTIEADRFLRNMVRAIVGTLLEVGRGRRSLADFSALILPPSPASAAAPSSSIPSPSAQASPSQSSSPESTLASPSQSSSPESAQASPSQSSSPESTLASPSQSSSPESTLASSPKAPSRRSEAGESVPGHALFLSDIQY